jgi:UDP-glucuronate decarboxylase
MRILVSGGAGFIGSHLCERLLSSGHEVVCADNYITGTPKNMKGFGDGFTMIEHDINVPFSDEQLEEIGEVERIFHLACPASPVDYREIPLQTLWVNAAGMKNMLELAVKNDAAFLHASTSEVYGDPEEHPQKETYWGHVNPIGERSCYNEGKRYAESMAVNYYKAYRFPLKIVRIFNTFGPRMRRDDGRVIPEFITRALSGDTLLVNGGGAQTRSFCYIDDMVSGLLAAMETPEEFTGPVNLGNPEEVSIVELAKKIIALTGSSSAVRDAGMPQDDPMKRKPDITLAREKFGFEPKVGLEEGLKRTIDYFRGIGGG